MLIRIYNMNKKTDMNKPDKSPSDDLKPGTYFYGPDGKKRPKSQTTAAVNTMRKALGIDGKQPSDENDTKKRG